MSTLSLWSRRDPFTAFDSFDALVRSAFGPAARPTEEAAFGFTPAADIVREGDDAIVRLEVPGLDPQKDVTVELDRGRLVVRGERRDETTREQGGRSLRELRYGSFRRSFGLADHVSADAISATYDAGVLSVRISGAYRRPSGEVHQIAVTPLLRPRDRAGTGGRAGHDGAGPSGVIALRGQTCSGGHTTGGPPEHRSPAARFRPSSDSLATTAAQLAHSPAPKAVTRHAATGRSRKREHLTDDSGARAAARCRDDHRAGRVRRSGGGHHHRRRAQPIPRPSRRPRPA